MVGVGLNLRLTVLSLLKTRQLQLLLLNLVYAILILFSLLARMFHRFTIPYDYFRLLSLVSLSTWKETNANLPFGLVELQYQITV